MSSSIRLRKIVTDDLEAFFEHQCDPVACRMAAFTVKDPTDRSGFHSRWHDLLEQESNKLRCILCNDNVAGHVASFDRLEKREVTYWLGKEYWGKGIATQALSEFIQDESPPVFARVASDNLGSIRVLEKCGFVVFDHQAAYANARGKVIEEFVMKYG